LQTCQPRLGEGLLAALQSSPAPPGEALLTGFLNEIAALPGRLVLILDDYHLLDSPPVDAALAFLIEHQPAQFHLVIASREDPLLPLARLRARNQLNELRAADLRFSPAEAAEFLNQVMGLDLTAGQITALESRTEGWISGLQLAALAIQGEQQPGGFIDSFTGGHRFVLDYLFEEVLQRQPQEIQAFLLRTSILEQLCGPLCDAILAAPAGASQATLEAIERANLFLMPLDGERRWYRYHHLFGDLLRQRLGSPPDLPAFHLRASQWYEESGSLAPAFQHALAAHDLERAARLAEAAWQAMDHTFQTSAWLGWVAKLPDGLVRSRPLLCSQVGWAYADAGQPETSERYLQSAAQALAEAPNQPGLDFLPGSIALGRAYNAQVRGDLAETLRLAELASQLVPQDDLFRRAQVTIVLEFTHWASGDLQLALRAIYAWMEDMQKAGNMMFVVASAFGAADLLVELGRLNEAEKVLRQAIQQAAAQGAQFEAITAHHHLCLALLAHERGQDEAAAASLQNAESLGRRTTLVDWPHRWKLALARFQASAGAWQAALDLLDEARQVYVQNPVPVVRPVAALQARLYLKQGRLDQAQAWALGRDLLEDGPPAYLAEFETLTLVRVRLAEQALAGLPDLLARLLAAAEAQHRQGGVLEILLTQVLVYQALDQPAQALAALQRALALAEPQGYLRLFVDEGEPLRLLLVALRSLPAEQALPSPAYLERLLAAFPPPPGSLRTPPRQNAELLEPLSERELEVLRLIAQGCSNTEISRRLYLALSTVKGYNLRIFARLGVKNRTEAVARARQLGLL
jgi:LuxR family maltose regulon positive regulatory protein